MINLVRLCILYSLPSFCDGEYVLWKFSAFSNFRNKKMCRLPLHKMYSVFVKYNGKDSSYIEYVHECMNTFFVSINIVNLKCETFDLIF